ncbi:hypothetical protein PP939_gp121 [Rhizobium phage RL38J1]|uniref:Uncharacterized protein n=1 Tax=Rhizobium phage RL38J1 TaxID=2663232 RepID=A0A6B9J2Y6_9CAUD|nr:hypothetical protein PP939_gp121 [Rhizobium phage RL38J1]QGZ13993.1 hypothetical protein RL38J1_121 [Rhizobium phage RL38J1]
MTPYEQNIFNRAVEAVREEYEYAAEKWNITTTPTRGEHTTTEYLVYIQDYLREAMTHVTRGADPVANKLALDALRKIANLAITAMIQNGIVERTP